MGNFVNRTTLEYRESVNDPEHVDPPWLFVTPGSPSATVIAAVEAKYWKIVGDEVQEMTAGEKAAVDAALLTDQRDLEAEAFDELESIVRAIVLIIMDELNDEYAARINSILAAADSGNYNGFASAMQAIADAPTRTPAQLRTAIRNRLGS